MRSRACSRASSIGLPDEDLGQRVHAIVEVRRDARRSTRTRCAISWRSGS